MNLEDRLENKQKKKLELFEEYIESGDSLLHLGCVGGMSNPGWSYKSWIHKDFEDLAETAIGIDIHEEAVERLQEGGHEVRVANAETFEMNEQFEVIVAPNVIEHLLNPGGMLEQAAAHLSDGGMVLVTTPRTWSLHHIVSYLKDGSVSVDPTHTMWFDDLTFRRLVELSPLEVERHETFSWERIPASKLDTAYLVIEDALRTAGVGGWLLDYQHFYVLHEAEE